MKRKTWLSVVAMLLAVVMMVGCFAGCAKKDDPATPTTAPASGTDTPADTVKEFSMFIAMPGAEINDGNAVQEEIAKLTGVKVKETWLTGQTPEEAVGVMVAAGEYPDFIDAGDGYKMMVDAGALVAIDEHWDNYPNIKNYLSEAEWNMNRVADGHIYGIPQFGIINGKDTSPVHNDEAFWVQTRVLKWAGYPTIKTLDQFFDVIEAYTAANPKHTDGNDVIPYTILCEGWRYFCLENAPFYLDGYPNDGCCIVDPETHKVSDYNTTPTAKRYFAKLNEEYKKGMIDPEFATQNYDQYISKISSGRVLSFVDQYWDWSTAEQAIKTAGMNDCTYVPLGLVIDEGIQGKWHSASAMDVSGGFSITTACKDLDAALQFVDDLLGKEVQTLRFWGIEGKDYLVGDDGVFYRTPEMRKNADDATYKADNLCAYSYFPQYEGMNLDGINAWTPGDQPGEFMEGMLPEVKELFEAYNVGTYVQLLNDTTPNADWYPMWSFTNDYQPETAGGIAWANMADVKHEYLPQVVMADDFDGMWETYMKNYTEKCDIDAFLTEIQAEVDRRIAVAQGN